MHRLRAFSMLRNISLLRGGWGCTAARSGKGILQTPAVRYPVFKELPVDMPIITHKRTAPEARSLMIAAGLSAVGLYRRCKCRFNTHVIYLDTSGICFRMDAPTGAHFLYGRVCSACMISTFFTWESYRFFHSRFFTSRCISIFIFIITCKSM